MLLIYTPRTSRRLIYTFDLIFHDILGCQYSLITDPDKFKSATGPKFSYGGQPLDNENVHFVSSGLLFEKGVRKQALEVFDFEGDKAFFKTSGVSSLPFDPFAATFFLASRYEEYLPHKNDRFGRFPAEESLAFQQDFLQRPVVNIWANKISNILQQQYPEFIPPASEYKFVPTYDIDSAFAYAHKGIIRTLGGFYKSVAEQRFGELRERTRVLLGKEPDPYDTFDWLMDIQQKYELNPIYFFLVGDYDEFDKNISIQVGAFRSLIKSIADYAEVGIHPSYASNDDINKLRMEINNLSNVLKREIKKSRQHFLKLSIPRTYQRLIELEISDDYTMGYASQIGFRAGICTPFYFYDMDYEFKTNLRVHPFAIMDVSLNDYMELNSDEAIDTSKKIIDSVKEVRGTFSTLWHNQTLTDDPHWDGWKDVYEEIVKYAVGR